MKKNSEQNRVRKHLGKIAIGGLVLVILAAVALGYAAYNGLEKRFVEVNTQNTKYQAQLQESLAEAQKQAEEATNTSQATKISLEIEKQRGTELAEDLASTKENSDQQIAELEDQLSQISTSADSSELVDEWEPRVGKIICNDSTSSWSGSGTAFKGGSNSVFVLTNFHVVTGAEYCTVGFPGDNKWYYIGTDDMGWDSSPYDWAYIRITSPTSYLYSYVAPVNFCDDDRATIGDSMLILGFPGSGATTTVTATQGIISGLDGEYLVTDAKIDHGNSGGAAIDVANNCFLGIPTAAKTGQIESYGRILDVNFIDDLIRLRL